MLHSSPTTHLQSCTYELNSRVTKEKAAPARLPLSGIPCAARREKRLEKLARRMRKHIGVASSDSSSPKALFTAATARRLARGKRRSTAVRMRAGSTPQPEANAHEEVLPMCLNCFVTYECEHDGLTVAREGQQGTLGVLAFFNLTRVYHSEPPISMPHGLRTPL
jgi:hypothetical protein